MFRDEKSQADRSESLERIHKKDGITPPLSQNAEDIGCSDIAAPERANINSRDTSGKVSCRKGSKQITKKTNGQGKEPHGDKFAFRETLGLWDRLRRIMDSFLTR